MTVQRQNPAYRTSHIWNSTVERRCFEVSLHFFVLIFAGRSLSAAVLRQQKNGVRKLHKLDAVFLYVFFRISRLTFAPADVVILNGRRRVRLV